MKDARPTSGRVLLALFSILGSLPVSENNIDWQAFSFLDLFAGTGRVGEEALRRGAHPVVFVETLKNRAKQIEAELQKAGHEGLVLALELRRALVWLTKREFYFDVIFADPPYNEGWGKVLLSIENLPGILRNEGILVIEHASREALTFTDLWSHLDSRAYGETTLSFFKKRQTTKEG